jgi:NAD-dependent deacetylase
MEDCRVLARKLSRARFVLVFTGAGMSTGSGIPDFRGPQGLWKNWSPVYFQEFMTDPEARKRHWEFKAGGWSQFREARPNPGHLALAELEKRGRLHSLVTQNIDGLHQLAGSSPSLVTELHGTNRLIECVRCGRQLYPDPIYQEFARTGEPPECSCGGWLKPATVSFGQPMPQAALGRAFREADRADVVISIGSTLEVQPAALVPLRAQEHGAFYAILNLGPTAHDHRANLRVEADASQFLVRVLEEIVGLS